jgi:hypothetical protein
MGQYCCTGDDHVGCVTRHFSDDRRKDTMRHCLDNLIICLQYLHRHQTRASSPATATLLQPISVLQGGLPVSGAPGRNLRNCTGFCAIFADFEHFCTGFTETSCANHTGNPCTLSQIARVFGPFAPNHTGCRTLQPMTLTSHCVRRSPHHLKLILGVSYTPPQKLFTKPAL